MEASDVNKSIVKVAPPSEFVSFETSDRHDEAEIKNAENEDDSAFFRSEENSKLEWDKILGEIFLTYSQKWGGDDC